MLESEMIYRIKELRTKLNLLPSHVDILGGCYGINRLKEIERRRKGPRVILEEYLRLLNDIESSYNRCAIPTEIELERCLKFYANNVCRRWHRGRPIGDDEWSGMEAEIQLRAMKRMKNFRHGGKKNICEFVYMSCYWSLRDIQNAAIEKYNRETLVVMCVQCEIQFNPMRLGTIRCKKCTSKPRCVVCVRRCKGRDLTCSVERCQLAARSLESGKDLEAKRVRCTEKDYERINSVYGVQRDEKF